VFSEAELEFLRSQRIARFATVGSSGWPHVVPVMYTLPVRVTLPPWPS
jgi:nitroimidazol reductase NimA-like FMN-containing flavoprotein (pyridoxamine 5'-phosphate oxidase superfamily)